ncbi:MAG: hypothetical protein QOF49_1733 [Chloroflexota bacterium]|jgi:ElaB/YqjD/DUF883 family membrane-anchored ribosome-binding protein|nr:hypothetical protein [Chloroflexota bacterium]
MGKGAHEVTERTTASSSSTWDADVLPTDTDLEVLDGSGGVTGDPAVDQLAAEIALTRSEMTSTVEELGDRLDPGTIAERTTEKVREATIGKVEAKVDQMANTASELATNASETVQETGSGVLETIRQNPIPAALAGFGIGWLVLNRQPRSSSAWVDRRSASTWSGSGYDQGGVADAVGSRAKEASAAVGDAASNAKQAAGDVASTVGGAASDAATTVGSTATSVASTAQRTIESNPLAIGAIAIAVGAAVGLALPASQTEKRVMGQAGSQLIDKAETAVTKPLEELENTSAR